MHHNESEKEIVRKEEPILVKFLPLRAYRFTEDWVRNREDFEDVTTSMLHEMKGWILCECRNALRKAIISKLGIAGEVYDSAYFKAKNSKEMYEIDEKLFQALKRLPETESMIARQEISESTHYVKD